MIDTSVHIIQAATTPRPPLPQESDELDFALPSRVRRDLGSFVSAVHHEMTFLKESGGSQKKITNGVRIQVQCNVIAYGFDSESELYLAEDAPVTVHAGGTDSEGTVLACEEFHLLLLLKQDIGESVPVAYISASPWKLLESSTSAWCA